MLPEHDAHRFGRFPEDRLVFGQQRASHREALKRRAAHDFFRRHPKHSSDVRQRHDGTVLEAKNGRLCPGFVDHSVVEKSQWRKACHAIVGQYVQEVMVYSAHDCGLNLVPECLASLDRTQVKQRTGRIHLLEYRVLHPIGVPLPPFAKAGSVKRWLER